MNTNINTGREVVVTASDEIGVLSRISTAIAEAQVNIRAVCAYVVDGHAHLRLITDDNQKAIRILNREGFKTTEHDILFCEVSPHVLHPNADVFAGGYDVENNYWCAATHSGEHALLVFSPSENVKIAGVR